MNKKPRGINMYVITIAAIALLVLVILSVIFIGRIGEPTQESYCEETLLEENINQTQSYFKTNTTCYNPYGQIYHQYTTEITTIYNK